MQCPIYKGSLETLIWLEKSIFSENFSIVYYLQEMRNCAVAENPQMKINISNKQKHAYLCIPDQKAFKGTGANLA